MRQKKIIIIGAGPAGLACAHEFIKSNNKEYIIDILEADGYVGGISKTVKLNGYYFDLGGHRFYSDIPEVNKLWEDTLGNDFLNKKRFSRIYYKNRFFNYPLSIGNVLLKLGFFESCLVLLSYLKRKIFPIKTVLSFEDWVINKFGNRLYDYFFKVYTKKVWGVEGNRISCEWAMQRIGKLSIRRVFLNSIGLNNGDKTLISKFKYPRYGPGMMYEKIAKDIKHSCNVRIFLRTRVINFKKHNTGWKIKYYKQGREYNSFYDNIVSTMPITSLIDSLDGVPQEILDINSNLKFRDFLIVCLVIKQKCGLKDGWIYIHDKDIKMGRLQIFNNWSEDMLVNKNYTSLGCEYFCCQNDEIWNMSDDDLISLSKMNLEKLKLINTTNIFLAKVIRVKKAYPVYDEFYKKNFYRIKNYINRISGLQVVGRGAMFRYNNMDHSIYAGMLAARNICHRKNYNLWDIK